MVHEDGEEIQEVSTYREQLQAMVEEKLKQKAALDAQFEQRKQKKEAEEKWRSEQRVVRKASLATAQASDRSVALAIKEVNELLKDRAEIKQNLGRLFLNHKMSKDAFDIALVKSQMANRAVEVARKKEQICRATLRESQNLLKNDGLKQIGLDLEDALKASNEAWDRVPTHKRKDAKHGRDRQIKKTAIEALKNL